MSAGLWALKPAAFTPTFFLHPSFDAGQRFFEYGIGRIEGDSTS
jgi:hypothetical protein